MLALSQSQLVRIKLHGLPSHLKGLRIVGGFDENGGLLRAVVPELGGLEAQRIDGESGLAFHERLKRLIVEAAE